MDAAWRNGCIRQYFYCNRGWNQTWCDLQPPGGPALTPLVHHHNWSSAPRILGLLAPWGPMQSSWHCTIVHTSYFFYFPVELDHEESKVSEIKFHFNIVLYYFYKTRVLNLMKHLFWIWNEYPILFKVKYFKTQLCLSKEYFKRETLTHEF